ncbi:MAG: isocitrate/isopropylmalate family dehydrogenase, partial [Thermoplasmatota archaeon]
IGDDYAIFEPTHGSAPKYTGKGVVNPIAMIMASKLMLDHLGEAEMGSRIEKAVADVNQEGAVRTKDLGGTSSTMEMAMAIASIL